MTAALAKCGAPKCVLIVDDEPDIRELLEITLGRMGIDTRAAECLEQARALLESQEFDLCLTDMRLPDGDGIDLVAHIQCLDAELPVAVITAHGNVDCAVRALKAGAFDFVSKPLDLSRLRALISSAIALGDLSGEAQQGPVQARLIGDSEAIAELRAIIHKLARRQAPVQILGESGTGKELVARLIHEQGSRAEKTFIPVNCAAIPSELMESEFFGHSRGSFTGAVQDKQGLFQTAHEGTLFLDEVGELPLDMQVKLLRVLQERAIRPVGTSEEVSVDVRILSATHRDLGEMVREGSFRQDLYYRINVIELHLPSLRDRPEDIPQLAKHILSRQAGLRGAATVPLTAAALHALSTYAFPGNVRELENILERAQALCESDNIDVDDLQLPERDSALSGDAGNVQSLEPFLETRERDAIRKALEETRYNKTAAARRLGITFRALRYRLDKLGID